MSNPKCALIVGHSMKSKGASGTLHRISKITSVDPCEYANPEYEVGQLIEVETVHTEFDLNLELAHKIKDRFPQGEIEIVLRESYSKLPAKVDKVGASFNVSMHFNAFNKKANGTEVLYYHTSEKSKTIARIFQEELLALGHPDRGILPRNSEDRGGTILKETKAPTVLCEPFFIDYEPALQQHIDNPKELEDAYVQGIKATMGYLWNE